MKKKSFSAIITTLLFVSTLGVMPTVKSFSSCPSCCVCKTECKRATFLKNEPIALEQIDEDIPVQGNPSPSILVVRDLPKCAVVKALKVRINNITLNQANLLSITLVSPCGDCIILMNQVGADSARIGDDEGNAATITFSDCDGFELNCTQGDDFIGKIAARPTDCAPGEYCFDRLSCTFNTQLSKTFCKPACGAWKLFTCLRAGESLEGAGSIESWQLTIDYCVPWC